jgi:hypothetical protein
MKINYLLFDTFFYSINNNEIKKSIKKIVVLKCNIKLN